MNKCPVGICQGELYLCGADHGDGWISESSDRWHCHNNSSHNFTIESLAHWEGKVSELTSRFHLVIYYCDTGVVECRSLTLEQIYTNLVTVGENLARATIERAEPIPDGFHDVGKVIDNVYAHDGLHLIIQRD